MNTTSFWADTASLPRFDPLEQDGEVDVAIIGAGITGVTAAHLFKRAGCRVALLECGRCGGFDSLNTTAHLTMVTDTWLTKLAKRFGNDGAKTAWDAGLAAIDQIVANIQEASIACEFKRIHG